VFTPPPGLQELNEAMILDGLKLTPSNDLRATKGLWVRKYVENLTAQETLVSNGDDSSGSDLLLTKSEKYKKAVSAWMASHLRSVLMSGKSKGVVTAVSSSHLLKS